MELEPKKRKHAPEIFDIETKDNQRTKYEIINDKDGKLWNLKLVSSDASIFYVEKTISLDCGYISGVLKMVDQDSIEIPFPGDLVDIFLKYHYNRDDCELEIELLELSTSEKILEFMQMLLFLIYERMTRKVFSDIINNEEILFRSKRFLEILKILASYHDIRFITNSLSHRGEEIADHMNIHNISKIKEIDNITPLEDLILSHSLLIGNLISSLNRLHNTCKTTEKASLVTKYQVLANLFLSTFSFGENGKKADSVTCAHSSIDNSLCSKNIACTPHKYLAMLVFRLNDPKEDINICEKCFKSMLARNLESLRRNF
jgi:hypothetical protein